MSLNLTCNQCELLQTPTAVTFECLAFDPVTGEPKGGHEGVRQRYIAWLEKMHQQLITSAEYDPERGSHYAEEIKYIKTLVNPEFDYI